MKKRFRAFFALLLVLLMLSATAIPVGAADFKSGLRSAWVKANDSAVVLADKSVGLKVGNAVLNGVIQPQYTLSEILGDKQITNIFLLSPEMIDEISDTLASGSEVYLVELKDGRQTYYIAVDFRDDNSVCFSNLFVLRATSRKLLDRTRSMADGKKGGQPVLMDYTHIVGELGIHYVGYRVTDAMGGERLRGLPGKVYHSCRVADLNLDEYRMLAIIRIVGLLIG